MAPLFAEIILNLLHTFGPRFGHPDKDESRTEQRHATKETKTPLDPNAGLNSHEEGGHQVGKCPREGRRHGGSESNDGRRVELGQHEERNRPRPYGEKGHENAHTGQRNPVQGVVVTGLVVRLVVEENQEGHHGDGDAELRHDQEEPPPRLVDKQGRHEGGHDLDKADNNGANVGVHSNPGGLEDVYGEN